MLVRGKAGFHVDMGFILAAYSKRKILSPSNLRLHLDEPMVPKRERSEEKHPESRTPPACQEKLHCRGQTATRRALSSGASTRIGSAAVRSRDLITPGCCSHKLLWWVIFAPLLLARTEGLQILFYTLQLRILHYQMSVKPQSI
jgi:hypothetical protein